MSVHFHFKFFTAMFVALLMSWSAEAQLFSGPISSATGGAGRAAIDPAESALLNPASVAHFTSYYGGVNYGLGSHRRFGKFDQFGAVLADGTPGNIISGALSYQRRTKEWEGDNSIEQDIQLSLGGFLANRFALGISGHRLMYREAVGTEYIQDNAHVGILFTILPNLGVGLVAYDVLPASEEVPEQIRVVPTHGLGLNYVLEEAFRFRLDLVRPDKLNPSQRINVMAGIETFVQQRWAFRLGAQWLETSDQMYVTTGLGFKGPRLSFDYAFQKDVRTDTGYRHLFDLWLPFW